LNAFGTDVEPHEWAHHDRDWIYEEGPETDSVKHDVYYNQWEDLDDSPIGWNIPARARPDSASICEPLAGQRGCALGSDGASCCLVSWQVGTSRKRSTLPVRISGSPTSAGTSTKNQLSEMGEAVREVTVTNGPWFDSAKPMGSALP
jgi:hypothetical protein